MPNIYQKIIDYNEIYVKNKAIESPESKRNLLYCNKPSIQSIEYSDKYDYPYEISGTHPEGIFVHLNIINTISPTDLHILNDTCNCSINCQ